MLAAFLTTLGTRFDKLDLELASELSASSEESRYNFVFSNFVSDTRQYFKYVLQQFEDRRHLIDADEIQELFKAMRKAHSNGRIQQV